jgi:predicted transcriptional regulator
VAWSDERRIYVRVNGEALWKLREEADIPQRVLAAAIGVSPVSICDYEKGRRVNIARKKVRGLAACLSSHLGRKVEVAELTLADGQDATGRAHDLRRAEPPAEVAS